MSRVELAYGRVVTTAHGSIIGSGPIIQKPCPATVCDEALIKMGWHFAPHGWTKLIMLPAAQDGE
jgi:hypothetical protein